VGFFALAAAIASSQRRFDSTAQRAPGSVVSIARHAPRTVAEGTGTYCAVVGFTPQGGAARSFESRFCGNSSSYRVGDRVVVLYDPAHPEDARIDDFKQKWGTALVTAGFGALALLFGLAGLLRSRRQPVLNPKPS
jgi:hypothetical protein